jgi:hypothetical protein
MIWRGPSGRAMDQHCAKERCIDGFRLRRWFGRRQLLVLENWSRPRDCPVAPRTGCAQAGRPAAARARLGFGN